MATHNWGVIILQRFSHRTEDSEPHVTLPSPGLLPQEDEPPRAFTLKASAAKFQEPHRTGGNGDFIFKGAHKISHALGPRTKLAV